MFGDTKLVKVKTSSGVAGRMDPTAWEQVEIRLFNRFGSGALVTISLATWHELVGRVYVRGKEKLFFSSIINRPMWLVANRLWRWHKEREYEKEYGEYAE